MPTWYPIKEFSLAEAKSFLQGDFMKVLSRTKHLYVDQIPKEHLGYGFFEPILLCLCWCDFLGALYCGDGKEKWEGGIGSTKRAQMYIKEIVSKLKSEYETRVDDIMEFFRHRTVHSFVPKHFDIRYNHPEQHLQKDGDNLIIHVPTFINDMILSVGVFCSVLNTGSQDGRGSLGLEPVS